MRSKNVPLILTAALLASSCASLRKVKEPVLIPSSVEAEYGVRVTEEVLAEFPEYRNPVVTNYIRTLGRRLAAVSDRRDIPYHFYVLKTNMVNAFAAPGGHIFVTTGLIKVCSDEAELAAVIGHELGHVTGRHSMIALQNRFGLELLSTLLFGTNRSLQKEVARIGAGLLLLSRSRDQEYEADRYGTTYTFRAGYDPNAMADFLAKLARMEAGGFNIEFLSTHPSSAKREAEARAFARQLAPDPSSLTRDSERFRTVKAALP